MFIRYYLDLPVAFADLQHALLDAPTAWLPGLAIDAEAEGERLLTDVGFVVDATRRVDKEVEIELGTAYEVAGKTVLPIAWQATSAGRAFPRLEADIEVAALGIGRTQLAISARYRPPLGAVGQALDRALLHRVAEATVKDFLERVGDRITSHAAPAVGG